MARPPLQLNAAKAVLAERGELRGKALAEAIGVATENLTPALRRAVDADELLKRTEGRAVFYRLPGQEPAGPDAPAEGSEREEGGEQPQEFNAAAWADGDVDLYGLIPLEDGGYRLTPAMVAKLKRLITWMPAEPAEV